MSAVASTHTLVRYDDALAVVRLGPGADVPDWATASTLFSVTATRAETSIVCHASTVPTKARREGPFVAFEVAGPLGFALTGVLSGLLAPLAEAEVSLATAVSSGAGIASTAAFASLSRWRTSPSTSPDACRDTT